ncbi:MAG: tail fiber domain-containing protein, partial [Clostridia bacterium]|nr:tail fiber domain-containing protein [Clostridia bacterium]
GKLYFKKIGESTSALNKKFFKSMKYGEKFKISRIAYEDGIQDFKQGSVENSTVWINQENMYITSQNQIDDIYDYYNEFEIYSFEGTSIIDPAVDVGDIIKINDKKIIYQGELSFAGKFIADIKSTIKSKSKQETSTKKKSEKLKIKRLESKIDQVEGNVTILSNEVTKNEEKLSEIKLDLDKINLKVEDIADLTNTVRGITKIKLEKCMEGDLISLHIYGNNTVFDRLYPSENLYPSNMLYPKGNSLIKVYDELEENVRIIDLKVDTVLRQYAGIFDEYILEDNKAKIIRRVDVDSFGNKYIREKEFIEDLGELNIALKKGTNYIEICDYEVNLKAKYVTINKFTDKFATTVELQSSITQLSDSINLQVSEKLNNKVGIDEVIAKINIAVKENQGTINIEGNQISIKSDNFELSNNGEITATAGKIAGLEMSKDRHGSYLSKKTIDDYGNSYQSGLYIPEDGNCQPFLYAGMEEGKNFLSSNAYITHDGRVFAKWFDVNGESGSFMINYDTNQPAMIMDIYGLKWKISSDYNNMFCALTRGVYRMYVSLYDAPGIEITDEVHNSTIIDILKYSPESDSGKSRYRPIIDIRGNVYIKGKGADSIGNTLYVQGYEVQTSASDERLKENIINCELDALIELNKIKIKSFDWKEDINTKYAGVHIDFGVIAQELKEINENYVIYDEQNDTWQINNLNVINLLIKAIQELSQENDKLKNKINDLETRISKLEKSLNKEEK